MNKKLLFAAMSLVAFTACTDTDFESQKVAEETSTVQFEVINANDAFTRASMGGTDNNTISWSAKDGDLFTLYFGASTSPYTSGYDNATYTAEAKDGKPASLTTPTMIKEGQAIMYWPVDTTFRIKTGSALTIKIPVEQVNTADEIPYVSDRIKIGTYTGTKHKPADYNTAGYDRKYPVYMRPMASQLNLKADYNKTDAKIAELYKGGAAGLSDEEAIKPIEVTSIDLLTNETGGTLFTKEIPVKFNETANTAWAAVDKNAFSAQTQFDVANIVAGIGDDKGQTAKLTAKDKCLLPNNVGAKILILPQEEITAGVKDGAVVVNTIYGKVYVADEGVGDSKYTATEAKDAWARYIKESTVAETYEAKGDKIASGEFKDKCKTTTNVANGMMQTINAFSSFKAPDGLPVKGEDMGTAINRYVKVLLNHLDMSDLHIKDDKQLRDVVRVWKKLGLDPVTVYLDGGQAEATKGTKNFEISQNTIKVINEVNGAYSTSNPTQKFTVKPCVKAGEECTKIVIAGGGDVQDIAFIVDADANSTTDPVANVALKAGEKWNWKGIVKVDANGVGRIFNEGTMENAATAILKTTEFNETQNNVRLQNNGTWNITAGTLNVQFNVTNLGKVNISKGAQYRQDGATVTDFTNSALTLPGRFLSDPKTEKVGVVNNEGVFATVAKGNINNYGLIEHIDKDAKTYITKNQQTGNFTSGFSLTNRMGRINLKYSNKDEDNISISATAPITEGFVSVTVTAEALAEAGVTSKALSTETVGQFVNYMIVQSGIEEISDMPVSGQIKYVEIADKDNKEIAWNVTTAQSYTGLIVLSPVNIKLGTKISADVTYLGGDKSEMYVGGTFNKTTTIWNGYYGGATTDPDTKYVTF